MVNVNEVSANLVCIDRSLQSGGNVFWAAVELRAAPEQRQGGAEVAWIGWFGEKGMRLSPPDSGVFFAITSLNIINFGKEVSLLSHLFD
jgi:hypothetical protein